MKPTMLVVLCCLLAFGAVLPAQAQTAASTVIVAWGGDVMLGRGVAQGMARVGKGDPLALMHARLDLADLRVANLEGPLTTQPRLTRSPYNLTAPPERVAVLVQARFDAMSLANNHATDHGRPGLVETLKVLRDAGIAPVGAGVNAGEGYAPTVLVRKGLRVALLAYDVTRASFTARPDAAGVATFDPKVAATAIGQARAVADVVIVQLHWGAEYATAPSQAQRGIAAGLAAAGADAVIGHHPHVVQPIEWLPRPGKRPTLVAYSLGNFVFDSFADDARRGALLETLLDRDGVVGFRAIPFATDWTGVVPLASQQDHDALTARLMPDPALRTLDPHGWRVPPIGFASR